jgi:hypothetical protein
MSSLYTKSGFSKSFGCCSYWDVCNKGENCVYEQKDPETMEGCSIHQRFVRTTSKVTSAQVVTEIQEIEEEPFSEQEGQLSLF